MATNAETVSDMNPIFEKLTARLDEHNARYRVVHHASAGKTEEVARVRGTQPGQGAKAMDWHVKGNGVRQYVLAILPSDQQADLQALAKKTGGTRASLASPAETAELTQCVFGAIPPFSFHPDLRLVADPMLFERFSELAFNAGSLECSIILNTKDYQRIADPETVSFVRREL